MAAFQITDRGSANFARLATFVMKEGTNIIRHNFMQNIIDNKTLPESLELNKSKMLDLKKKNLISDVQFNILYPPDSLQPSIDEIDMTLWLVLSRNLSKGKNHVNWNTPPKQTDIRWQHDALRIKEIRNRLFHLRSPELAKREFQDLWHEARDPMVRLGTSEEVVQEYLTQDLDPIQTRIYTLQVKEQVLEERCGVYVLEGKRKRHLYILIITFILVAAAITVVVVASLRYLLKPPAPCLAYRQHYNTDLGLLQYEPRRGWGAVHSLSHLETLHTPVPIIGIFHTAIIGSSACQTSEECCALVRYIQLFDMSPKPKGLGFDDIAYNFLIGGDGVIYEGRGWDKVSASAQSWNPQLISIGFMGNFMEELPTKAALQAARVFFQYLVSQNKVQSNYKLLGHCQMRPSLQDSPGAALYHYMKNWPHYSPLPKGNCTGDNTLYFHPKSLKL